MPDLPVCFCCSAKPHHDSTDSSSYAEPDYRRVAEPAEQPRFLEGTNIEIVRPLAQRAPPRHVLFDFDGTLSLIREGWPEVMVPMMVEVLQATGTDETPAELSQRAGDFVMQLTGKQTIYQMIRLAEEVRGAAAFRSTRPNTSRCITNGCWRGSTSAVSGSVRATLAPAEMMVPYSFELLDEIGRTQARRSIWPAAPIKRTLTKRPGCWAWNAISAGISTARSTTTRTFSKAMVIERILAENKVDGTELLGFGDGYVEIHNIKAVAGTAVAVASDEAGRSGRPDPWKRDRLIGAGADLVIADYREHQALIRFLWNEG